MTAKIGFKDYYRLELVKGGQTFLLSEKGNVCLKGELFYSLAPLLAKELYDEGQLVEILQNEASAAEVYYALEVLKTSGYIEEKQSDIPKEFGAFCNFLNVSSEIALSRLKTAKIFVQTLGEIDAGEFARTLENLGIQLVPKRSDADFSVLLVDDYQNDGIEAFNASAVHPWLLMKPVGIDLWIGPLFEPKETGCFECLRFNLHKQKLEESYIKHRNQKMGTASIASLSSTRALCFQLAATELVKRIVQGKKSVGKVITFDVVLLKLQEHLLIQRHSCPICGSGSISEPKPVVLSSLKKSTHEDGGSRVVSPEETIEKFSHLISPITGVIGNLESNQKKLGAAIHNFWASHNFANSNAIKGIFRKNLRAFSGGKGKTWIQAKASALCEGIERFSGVYQGIEFRKKSSFKKLKEEAIHPHRSLLFSQNQYEMRNEWNTKSHSFHLIPKPFSEDEEMDWSPVWSLTRNRHQFLPTAFLYFAHPNCSNVVPCSNGNAAGNTIEEAILHGMYELIERDSVAIWWYNRLIRPRVNLEPFQDPFFQQLTADYQVLGREFWVLDITSDLQIPVFAALSKNLATGKEIVFGFGCDLNPKIAISRALTEMNQCLRMLDTDRKSTEDIDDKVFRDWLENVSLEDHPYLAGNSEIYFAYKTFQYDDFKDDIQHCLRTLEAAGLETFVLDQTRPEIKLPVVKVIVPGLRHFWPRFAPGRLYDVPVKMGWLTKPLAESELNPIGMFL